MAERTTTPPPLQGPTAKEKKYDRQLRLWAASGQQALEEAKVLLLNSGSGVVGVETLKNLILPGVGNYTIVDEAEVAEKDLGVNFFLEESSLGKSRAEESCRLLQELNPEVNGSAVQESIEAFVQDESVLDEYSLILLVGPTKDASLLAKIVQHAQTSSIPLFYIHCAGFYSYFSVQLPPQFPIVDTHPDPASTQDLRLLNSWPELQALLREKTKNIDSLSDHDHGHIPYLLLLLHYLEVWKSTHDSRPPASYSEKKEFKALVEGGARKNNAEGSEENYDEAAAAVLKSLNPPAISSGLRDIFESAYCKDLRPDSANFWVIAHAIGDFHSKHGGILPLPGTLPDMKAQSSDYIQLQNIYKAKARSDLAEVTGNVRHLEQNRAQPIEAKEIEAFCKGAQFAKLIHGRAIRIAKCTENIRWDDRVKALSHEFSDPTSLLPIYFAFLALDRHHDDIARIHKLRQQPTAFDVVKSTRAPSGAQLPLPEFARSAHFYTPKGSGIGNEDPKQWPRFDTPEAQETFDNVVAELERADGAELHNIAALTGGMVAQEAIKVLTKQYVPVNNTCVFDGIQSRTAVFDI